jgi:hypothetical protein
VSKYSLTSWPEVIVVFHGEYKRTVNHTLKHSHYRAARTTASLSHRDHHQSVSTRTNLHSKAPCLPLWVTAVVIRRPC